jgi:hypothetical protein
LSIRSQSPELDDAQVRDRILKDVEMKANFQGKVATNGRVNAYQALTSKAGTPPPSPSPPLSAPPSPPSILPSPPPEEPPKKKKKGKKGKKHRR